MSVVFGSGADIAGAALDRSSDDADASGVSGSLAPDSDVVVDATGGRPRKGRHYGTDLAVLQRCESLGLEHARHGSSGQRHQTSALTVACQCLS